MRNSAMKLSHIISSLILPVAVPVCLTLPGTAAIIPSAPENHETAYRKFKETLDNIVSTNSSDTAPALIIALDATGDELCIDAWMQRAANEGNPAALLYLGSTALNFVPQTHRQSAEVMKAVNMVKKASATGYTPAVVTYSNILRTGVGCVADPNKANKIMMEACKSGNIETRFSWLLQTDRLLTYEDRNRPEVKGEITRGNHHVLYYLSRKAPDAFVKLCMLTEAARMGNATAMFELSAYMSQLQNEQVSYHYLKKAAELHHPQALTILGEYLVRGNKQLEQALGLQRDEAAGVYLLKIATMMGNTRAQAMLSHIYYLGACGLPKDDVKAYRHIELGSQVIPDISYTTAQGYMLLMGHGVKQDTQKGLSLIKKAADIKFPHAVFMLANIYYQGLGGVPANGQEAVYLLESMATTRGLEISFIFLAYIYEKGGPDIKKDPAKVRYYLGHAERVLGKVALDRFEQLKNDENGWVVTPFNIQL